VVSNYSQENYSKIDATRCKILTFKAKMQKIRFLLGARDAFLDPAGGAYSTPLTPSWCGGVW